MAHAILGLHHVTATVGDAQADLDFCLDLLGLRLVKKTVNFDNHDVYHFYYGTERGAPGTIWTTFPYKDRGVRVGAKGAGQVVATAFSVPAGSLEFWRRRLEERVLAESPRCVPHLDVRVTQTRRPEVERPLRHRERRRRDLSGPFRPDTHVAAVIGKRRPDRARRAPLVAVIEMEDVMVVEVDGLLDEAKTERPDAEVQIRLRLVHGRGHVMQAENPMRHHPTVSKPATR